MLDNNKRHAKRVANLIRDPKTPTTSVLGGIWHWINGIADGIGHFIGGPITSALRAMVVALKEGVAAMEEGVDAIQRGYQWVIFSVVDPLKDYVDRQLARIRARERQDVRTLFALIYAVGKAVLAAAYAAVRRERRERVKAITRAEVVLRRDIKAMHQTIEREAASGYRVNQRDRLNLIVRLLDFAVLRNPELGALVKDATGAVLDLLSVDDPLARLLLGFVIKQVIDRLGIDKAVGKLIDDLLAPILGKPKPDGIHDVVLDLSNRMIASEGQWAQFMEDGGSQVEQAGREWRNITSVAGGLAIVGFVAEAVHNPQGWAAAIADTVGVAANDVATRAVTLFEGA